MGRGPSPQKKRKAGASAPAAIGDPAPSGATVSVPIPQDASITVHDLNTFDDEERFEKLLEDLKTAKVRFVILNAPFKLRPVAVS
jgi:hypothetical protein